MTNPTSTTMPASPPTGPAGTPERAADEARAVAFFSSLHDGLFHAFAYSNDVWKSDPFDVESIHAVARDRFSRMVDRVLEPSGLASGRILLLLGDSGCGKTHLMRAFRNLVHARHRGYCGYMQMTSYAGQYGRYALNNLIDSLDRPYLDRESPRTGLMRLSDALADALGEPCRPMFERLREGGLDQAAIDAIIGELADRVILDARFADIDVYILQALLYLQCDDPRIKARVLKYLRCEDLTPHDRRLLGGIVPSTYPDAPNWVMLRLGQVIWAVERVPLILCVDQLEDVFDLEQAAVEFRKALATLCDLVSRLPSAIVVISCLDDYYAELKKLLTRPIKDRVENDPRPIGLQTPCDRDEVVRLIALRLRFLFESASVPFDPGRPTSPLPEALIARLVGLRARDVLLECRNYRERCVEEGKMAAYPPEGSLPNGPGAGPPSIEEERPIGRLEQAWNESRTAAAPLVPTDEGELAVILARALRSCSAEVAGHRFEAEPDGRFVRVADRDPIGSTARIMVGIGNKGAQGGGLGKQVEELIRRAIGQVPVAVRSTAYPTNPRSEVFQLLARLSTGGGRVVVVEDSDWRTMLALARFREAQQSNPSLASWQAQTRPLTSLKSVRIILGLDIPANPAGPEKTTPVAGAILDA